MPVEIHGKEYTLVAERMVKFRNEHPDYPLITKLVESNESIVIFKAIIKNENNQTLAVGHAEEVRGSTMINRTSALENCETSAIGRALSALGYGSEGSYASAEEVAEAHIQQKQQEVVDYYTKHNKAVFENLESLEAIRGYISADDYASAFECWNELGEDIQILIWRAPSKGGYFTTREREIIKSPEFKGS